MSLAKVVTIFIGVQLKYLLIGMGLFSLVLSFTSFSWAYVPIYALFWWAGGVVCWLAAMFVGK